MSANAQDFDFEYDKPGAERSRRRRGQDDTLESDLEEDLLEEDWLSGKKNPSEVSDEELNDDLLQSDDEDANIGDQGVSLNVTYNTSYDELGDQQNANYTDDIMNLGVDGCEEGDVTQEEGYTGEYSHEDNQDISEDQINYSGDLCENEDGYQDEVLDLQINEPIDGEFQDEDYQTSFTNELLQSHETTLEEDAGRDGGEEQPDQEDVNDSIEQGVYDKEEGESETLPHDESKEESNEEEEEDEESGRIRFKSERKDGAIVRLADSSNKRRNIPDKLELSEKAKKDLMEFEEQERQKRQNRYGGRGGRGGGGGGRGGPIGGRGRGGLAGFGMPDFRGGKRGRMHGPMPHLMGNIDIQQASRMVPAHQLHQSRSRAPPPFHEHGRIPQQPLQPLMPPHMAHRSPPVRPQLDTSPRLMNSPPPNFPQHHQQQQQPPQPKNIHINPHFRGPSQSSVQVPLMPPAQSQPRPAVGPQRFPGPGDFPRMPGNFGQPQRPPHHIEPLRSQPHQGPQDREPMFMGERGDSVRFPGQHMFDHQIPNALMNSGNPLNHHQQLPGQAQMGFGPPRPPFNQPGQGPLGLFQREAPRPNLPSHQGHQGMMNFNQQGGPLNQPRPFMGPRQPFGQQANLFPHPQDLFGMQGLLPGPSVSSLPHHEQMPPRPMHPQLHRQELAPHQQQPLNLGEPRPMLHHGQTPFHQQQNLGSPRQMTGRSQNAPQRGMPNRQRMNTPITKPMQQRNSNLRELPVATNNTIVNVVRPAQGPAFPAPTIKPVARATQGIYPGQTPQPMLGVARGRGQVPARAEQQILKADKSKGCMEVHNSPASTAPQDPDEDEETRQYRLKIEEQKRLREEILRRKELRRQMQAGVRKKELMERLNSQTATLGQGNISTQNQPLQAEQQTQHSAQQQPQQLDQKQQLLQVQQQQQQQRQFPPTNQIQYTPNQDSNIPFVGASQTPAPRPNVKARLQLAKGAALQQSPLPGSEQQWRQQSQQQSSSVLHGVQRPNSQTHPFQMSQNNNPMTATLNQGPAHAPEPKPGAKRTVMQRAKVAGPESQQVPQKVRVVKLSTPIQGGKGPETATGPDQQQQQQASWGTAPLNQGIQRKVTMSGQHQGPGGPPQPSNQQQNRVVVSGRGRGRGGGTVGRGRPVTAKQNQRIAENKSCTVSIEGLSTSTTEFQLKNLLQSIGPIEMFKMLPQQRKAVARFSSPQHAMSFQMSFHRHMIDLSHIDVSLIDG